MTKDEIIKLIKRKKPFFISSVSCFQGNFEIIFYDSQGERSAFGWGAYIEPSKPYSLQTLLEMREEGLELELLEEF
jgi:hypothetical protein